MGRPRLSVTRTLLVLWGIGVLIGCTTVQVSHGSVEAETVGPNDRLDGGGGAGEVLFFDDFEDTQVGTDPARWIDTDQENGLTENDALFRVELVDGSQVLATTPTTYVKNFHSHIQVPGASEWANYAVRGRFQLSADEVRPIGLGLGMTAYSKYPLEDRYYRMRYYATGDEQTNVFETENHGDWDCIGSTRSMLTPEPGRWYRFLMECRTFEDRVEFESKICPDGTTEPEVYTLRCQSSDENRPQKGTVGVWANHADKKYFDDIEVRSLE